jgi:hypothetical protein
MCNETANVRGARLSLILAAIYGSSDRYTSFKILIKKRFLTATTQRMNRFCT